MNKYIVARATQDLANYIKQECDNLSDASVVIIYDIRNFSSELALCTAQLLSSNGIKVHLFDNCRLFR